MGIRIIGTGSFVPPQVVNNDLLMECIQVHDPRSGKRIGGEWLERHFGIKERRMGAFDFTLVQRISQNQGGLYDSDLAIRAAQLALDDAGARGGQVDSFIHVSCTPDENDRCWGHLRRFQRELGLRADADKTFHNLGCAGLAKALRTAQAEIEGRLAGVVLVVASNCSSAQFGVRSRYDRPSGRTPDDRLRAEAYQWAWLSSGVFGDGAAAMVLTNDASAGTGLLGRACETWEDTPLVTYPAGGGLCPTTAETADDHLYLMDPQPVAEAFQRLMPRNVELLREQTGLAPADFARVYVHQANGPLVRVFGEMAGIPTERLAMNIHKYANTSAASTPLMFDEDRRSGTVGPGCKVLFLWIGAGAGAMNGFAAFQL